MLYFVLHKISKIHLISWCVNFVETQFPHQLKFLYFTQWWLLAFYIRCLSRDIYMRSFKIVSTCMQCVHSHLLSPGALLNLLLDISCVLRGNIVLCITHPFTRFPMCQKHHRKCVRITGNINNNDNDSFLGSGIYCQRYQQVFLKN